jgi:hypothetical protein
MLNGVPSSVCEDIARLSCIDTNYFKYNIMAKNVTNEKGFKVIALKPEECRQIGFGFQDETDFELICDNCNELINNELYVFYVCALNRVLCKSCFQDWYEDAVRYPEDTRYEDNKYELIKSLIENRGLSFGFKNVDYNTIIGYGQS